MQTGGPLTLVQDAVVDPEGSLQIGILTDAPQRIATHDLSVSLEKPVVIFLDVLRPTSVQERMLPL